MYYNVVDRLLSIRKTDRFVYAMPYIKTLNQQEFFFSHCMIEKLSFQYLFIFLKTFTKRYRFFFSLRYSYGLNFIYGAKAFKLYYVSRVRV